MDRTIVTAKLGSARVYTNGCVLTARGEVRLVQGVNEVLVDCLAQSTVEDSLRVRMPASVALISVNVVHEGVPELSDAQKAVAECEKRIRRVVARMSNREMQKQLWIAPAGNGESCGASLSDLGAYIENLPVRLDALDDELAELQAEKDALQQELEDANRRLDELRRLEQRGFLCVCVSAQEGGSVPFEVELRSEHASWRPVYDVLVASFDETLQLRLRAEVRQSTGIDWEDVHLTLSTAAPVVRGMLPRLSPTRLRKHVERQAPRYRRMMSAMSAPMAASPDDTGALDIFAMDEEAMPEEALFEMSAPEAMASTLVNSVEYNVSGIWSVPSGGEAVLVEVQTISLAAAYRWRAVPALDDSVYIAAVLEEPLSPAAMGQQASVYLQGEFCGKVILDEPSDDEPLEISLGVDTRMRTERKLVRRKSSSSRLRGRLMEESIYELKVHSHRDDPVTVLLCDQVPISEDRDIVVETGECAGATRNAETGELRWQFDLAPHAVELRRFGYTVSRPKDLVIETVSL